MSDRTMSDRQPPESPVLTQLGLLEKEIELLSVKQNILEERLQPVLRIPFDSDKEEKDSESPPEMAEMAEMAEVAGRLRLLTNIVQIQHQRWCDILSRLEL